MELNDKELAFCDLFVFGEKEYAGQCVECYAEVWGVRNNKTAMKARQLLAKEYIAEHIAKLVEQKESVSESMAVKLQVAETLRSIMREASKGEYIDKFGVPMSPASLRAVSVNAAKALMEIYPIKHSQNEGGKDGASNGNITFNVVVPQIVTGNGEKEQ